MKKLISTSLFALTGLMIAVSAQPASAKIVCKDSYQIVNGTPIATPYCGDKWLARISGVSFRAIRNDYSVRQRVCSSYGSDPRVASICGSDADYFRRRF